MSVINVTLEVYNVILYIIMLDRVRDGRIFSYRQNA